MSVLEIAVYLGVILGICVSSVVSFITMADMRKCIKEVRQMYFEEHQAVMDFVNSAERSAN